MAVEFTDAVLAGVTLVREAIQSQNFVQGEQGWRIAADGKAEFSDLLIRSSDGSQSTVTIANGVIEVRDGSGNLVARVDNGGFWTRGFQFPENIVAELSSGKLEFRPLVDGQVDFGGGLDYGYQPAVDGDPAFVYVNLSSGWISSANYDTGANVRLVARQGERPYAHFGDEVAGDFVDLKVAGQISGGNVPQYIRKTADTSRNDATMADDPDLTCQLDANSTYEVELVIFYSAEAVSGFRTEWAVPIGAEPGYKGVIGAGPAEVDTDLANVTGRFGVHNYTTNVEYGNRNGNAFCMATERAVMTIGAVGGTFALRWSQITADASVYSTVGAGSYLKVTKVA